MKFSRITGGSVILPVTVIFSVRGHSGGGADVYRSAPEQIIEITSGN